MMQEFDHRVLGIRLELFHQQDEAPGMVFWHPRGWQFFRVIEGHIRSRMRDAGFHEVRTPQLLARSLWERSGHWEKFRQSMYSLEVAGSERAYCLETKKRARRISPFYKRLPLHKTITARFVRLPFLPLRGTTP